MEMKIERMENKFGAEQQKKNIMEIRFMYSQAGRAFTYSMRCDVTFFTWLLDLLSFMRVSKWVGTTRALKTDAKKIANVSATKSVYVSALVFI